MITDKEGIDTRIKVNNEGERFFHKPKHDLKDKKQVFDLILQLPSGIGAVDLKDAYPTSMEGLQALKAAGQIRMLSNFDSKDYIAYPYDPKSIIKVDDDLRKLFRGIELRRDKLDIEKHLQMNGMMPASNTAKRREAAQVKGMFSEKKIKNKKRGIRKIHNLTNPRLPELFENLGS